jgi:hypothetical protein
MTIRSEQINLTGYYTKSEVDVLIPSTDSFATHTEVSTTSGILNTYIANTSGQLDSRITSSGSYAVNTSGQLSTRINDSGAYCATTSGQLNTKIDTLSGFIVENLALGINYYLSNDASDKANHKYMAVSSSGTLGSISGSITDTSGTLLYSFITLSGVPNFTSLEPGVITSHLYLNVLTGHDGPTYKYCQGYIKLFKMTTGDVETQIGPNSNLTPYLTSANTPYNVDIDVPAQVTLNASDRLIIRVYGVVSGTSPRVNNPTLIINYGGANDSHLGIGIDSAYLINNFAAINHNHTLASLSGVAINSPLTGQLLTYNSGLWINQSGTGGAGVTDHGALTGLNDDDHSAIYYNKTTIDTTSGILNTNLTNTSGQLSNRINNLTLDSLSGVTINSVASGHVLSYNGAEWGNSVPATGGGSFTGLGGIGVGAYARSINTDTTDAFWSGLCWDKNLVHDSGLYTHSTTSNEQKIYVNSSGMYLCQTFVMFGSMGSGPQLQLRKNGAEEGWGHIPTGNTGFIAKVFVASSGDYFGSYVVSAGGWISTASTFSIQKLS